MGKKSRKSGWNLSNLCTPRFRCKSQYDWKTSCTWILIQNSVDLIFAPDYIRKIIKGTFMSHVVWYLWAKHTECRSLIKIEYIDISLPMRFGVIWNFSRFAQSRLQMCAFNFAPLPTSGPFFFFSFSLFHINYKTEVVMWIGFVIYIWV